MQQASATAAAVPAPWSSRNSKYLMIAICHLSVVPVRKEPSDRSEMTTQLLMGDLVEINGEDGNWRKVTILDDGYSGWVDVKQVLYLSDEEALIANDSPVQYSDMLTATAVQENGTVKSIVLGSHLPSLKNGRFVLGPHTFTCTGTTITPDKPTASGIERQAMKYLNAPYLWGGKSPFGIDCSGFTQMVFRLNGISLPRDAWQQALKGALVDWSEGVNTGDLAFFENADKKVVHVGVVLAGNRIIHASGQVRIDTLDADGIVRTGDGVRTHRLCCIRRYF